MTAASDRVLAILTSKASTERVLVVQRADGAYSFRRQWLSGDWGTPGPYCGIYDSQQTAEQEAFGRVPWLAHLRPN